MKRRHAPLLLLVIGAILAAPAASQTATVTLTVPGGIQTGETVTLTAGVSPGGTYTVRFYEADAGSDCSSGSWAEISDSPDTVAPYTAQWTAPGSPGQRALKAVAFDSSTPPQEVGCGAGTADVQDPPPPPEPPPAPELSLSAAGVSTHASSTEDRVYVNTNPGGAGTYTVTATPNDPDVVSVRFPGFTDDTPPFAFRYQHDELAEGPWPVTSRKATGPASAEAVFVVDHDTTIPAGVSVRYAEAGGNDPDGVIHLALTNGTDLESGIDSSTALLERQVGTVAPGPLGPTCSNLGARQPTPNPNTLGARQCAIYHYGVSDNVGNVASDTTVEAVWYDPRDVDPPGNVRNPSIRTGDHVVTVRYWFPVDPDFAGVKIIRSIAGVAGSERLAFNGRARRFVDRSVFNGTRYVYKIATFDTTGNQPNPAVFMRGVPRSRFLLAPRDGAILRRPPLLDWKARRRARFYNVKVLRDAGPGPAREVLSVFPRRSKFQMKSTWRYKGHIRRFSRGTYFWYVWPRIGGRYGALMGWQRFVVPRR
jgi:hypothetical protein